MYSKEIYFHLPFNSRWWPIIDLLIKIYNEKKMLYENVKIGSIYGSYNSVPWNGGRVMVGEKSSESQLEYDRDFLNSNNIPFRFTFTNCLIDENLCKDWYSNMILKIFSNGKNEIICNSDTLEKYIRNLYKDSFRYISSTTKCIRDINEFNKELKKYYLTVLDYNFNNNFNDLSLIKEPKKCEILCNAICMCNCPRRKKHYERISKSQILECDLKEEFFCESEDHHLFYEAMKSPLFVSKELIEDKYIPMGFKNFKLEGRTHEPFDIVEILNYYLIKPEYSMEFREKMYSLF